MPDYKGIEVSMRDDPHAQYDDAYEEYTVASRWKEHTPDRAISGIGYELSASPHVDVSSNNSVIVVHHLTRSIDICTRIHDVKPAPNAEEGIHFMVLINGKFRGGWSTRAVNHVEHHNYIYMNPRTQRGKMGAFEKQHYRKYPPEQPKTELTGLVKNATQLFSMKAAEPRPYAVVEVRAVRCAKFHESWNRSKVHLGEPYAVYKFIWVREDAYHEQISLWSEASRRQDVKAKRRQDTEARLYRLVGAKCIHCGAPMPEPNPEDATACLRCYSEQHPARKRSVWKTLRDALGHS